MRVILTQKVESLGKAGDTLNVSDGYARNFLIPRGMATEADFKNLSALEHETKKIQLKEKKARKSAEALAEKFKETTCTITRRVGAQNKMFGSVNAKDIQSALEGFDLKVDRKNILLEEPIKSPGEFLVPVKLSAGVTAEIKVIVSPEI